MKSFTPTITEDVAQTIQAGLDMLIRSEGLGALQAVNAVLQALSGEWADPKDAKIATLEAELEAAGRDLSET